jgi:uncharacterized membrane protein
MTSAAPPSRYASRPLGVSILSILIGIYGFLLFLGGLLLAVLASATLSFASLGYLGLSATDLGIITAIIGLIVLAVAVGLWHLRMWALALAVIVLLLEIVSPIIGLARGTLGTSSIVDLVIAVLLLAYLLAVRHHFS